MNSIILCEGYSDFVFLQYYMRKMYAWEDQRQYKTGLENKVRRVRTLTKDGSFLSIGGCGGCSNILPVFDYICERNSLSADGEDYGKIVIITDRDEVDTEKIFSARTEEILQKWHMQCEDKIVNNAWCTCRYVNGEGLSCTVKILLLVIPFEETGALESFLLHAVTADDPYDGGVISSCERFVESVDPLKRYLIKRRHITKAKFDVYFSVRTSAEQFVERQNIFMRVPWEKSADLQKKFEKLGDL